MRLATVVAMGVLVCNCVCTGGSSTGGGGGGGSGGGGGLVDLCLGVTCESPPGLLVCYVRPGTCDAGQCHYAFANGAGCDDGDACTTGDVCSGGSCSGTAVTCNDPPARICMGAQHLEYSDAGSCVMGACTYPSSTITCADGVCDGRTCGNSCVDLSADPANCGACGHACIAGGCSGGACFLTTVDSDFHPWLAVDDTGLYWSTRGIDAGAIGRIPLDGGPIETLAVVPSSLRPWALGLSDTSVHFVAFGDDGGAVLQVAKAGGPLQVQALEWTPTSIAVDDQRVYWSACESTSTNPSRRRIASVPKAGGPVSILASTPFCPQQVAVDSDAVYWTELGNDAGLMRVPLDGGAAVRLAPTFNQIQSVNERLAVSNAAVWWLRSGGGLGVVPKGGGGITSVAAETAAMGVDKDHVYWLTTYFTPGRFQVWKQPTDGGLAVAGRRLEGLGTVSVSSCTGLAVGRDSLFAACGGATGTKYRLLQLPK